MNAEAPATGRPERSKRWLTRLVGYSFLSLPFVLLLTAIGINYVTRYGFPRFIVHQTPEPNWRAVDLVSAVADRRNGHRYRASQILGHRAPQDVVPLVLPLLESADATTRKLALTTLGKLERGAASALPQVLSCVDDPDSEVAAAALSAAAAIAPDDPQVEQRFRAVVPGSKPPGLQQAVWAIGQLDPVPVDLLVRMLRHPDPQASGMASQLFQKHGQDGRDAEAVVREIERWLKSLTSPHRSRVGVVIRAYRLQAVPVLRRTVRTHPAVSVRLLAITELAYLPNEPLDEFIPDLHQMAESGETDELRMTAIELLSRMRRAGVPALRELAASTDEYVRFRAQQALAVVERAPTPTDELIGWLTTSKHKVIRAVCIHLLAARGHEAAKVTPLLESLRDDSDVGDNAKRALQWLTQDAATVEPLQPEGALRPSTP